MTENIKVAVRLRPFSEREIKNKSQMIINMHNNTTEIRDPKNPSAEPKTFTYDYSYWSHDGYKVREKDGYYETDDRKYVDQDRVYKELGMMMLNNAWDGYNASIFAYGQTGSGKSYSIMGHGANKGIVPRICEDLFSSMHQRRKEGVEYRISFSMVEIYNEVIRDLLNKKNMPKNGLPVRESASAGFYVQGLTSVPVANAQDIQLRIVEGDRHRTLAATKMNETSSRAHTLVTVHFDQKNVKDNKTKQSVINLVDLAGSERNKQTEATGDRFTESKSINQSLMTLGTVIKCLFDKSQGRKCHIPFRDSKLTLLLKNALGGNSKTIMIAAISPSDENYEQTLSTLKYANRAKSISNKAVINEAETDKIIRELMKQNEALLKELSAKSGGYKGYSADEIQRLKEEKEEEIKRYQMEISNVESAWQKRLDEHRQETEKLLLESRKEKEDREKFPHIWNLNEDPALTSKVYHVAKEGKTIIGNRRSTPAPEILLHGPSIAKQHAYLLNDGEVVSILQDQGQVHVNGEEVRGKRKLQHQDRLYFGSSNIFVFHHPQEAAALKKKGRKLLNITYDFAQQEIARSSGIDVSSEDSILQQEVLSILPWVQDANAMAIELEKFVEFEPCLLSGTARGQEDFRTELFVKMRKNDNDFEFMWSKNKFINRLHVMREIYQRYEEGEESWEVAQEEDPFWEPDDAEVMIGVVYIHLESLAHMMDFDEQGIILDYRAQQRGFLEVCLLPCKPDGQEPSGDTDDLFVEEPMDLAGSDIAFKVKIQKALNLARKYAHVWCRYRIQNGHDYITTPAISPNQAFNFAHLHTLKNVTHQQVDFFMNESLAIEVWGRQRRVTSAHQDHSMNKTTGYKKVPTSKTDDKQTQVLQSELNMWKKKAEKMHEQLIKIDEAVKKADYTSNRTIRQIRQILDN